MKGNYSYIDKHGSKLLKYIHCSDKKFAAPILIVYRLGLSDG